MKITNVKITNLFGIYNYDLDINTDEPLTILFAKNGRGKTTIMRLIKAALTVDVVKLNIIEFSELCITFETGCYVKVDKKNASCTFEDSTNLAAGMPSKIVAKFIDILYDNLHYTVVNQNGETEEYPIALPDDLSEDRISLNNNSDGNSLKDMILEAASSYRRRNRLGPVGGFYRLSDVKVPFSYILKEISREDTANIDLNPQLLSILSDLCSPKAIKFVESNRLLVNYRDEYERESTLHENILLCSKDLKNKINEAKKQMEILSDELDRSFPKDLLLEFEDYIRPIDSEEVDSGIRFIKKELRKINEKREQLSQFGLIEKTNENDYIFENEVIPIQYLPVLNLYSSNTMKKLAVLNDIYERINWFTGFINEQDGLSNKKLHVNAEDGIKIVSSYSNKEIPLDKLSSGEKNIIILFYELIFNSNEGSLVFVDEPEISLHIAWQDKYIEQLLKICNRNKMQAIVATHSPDIIGNYDYLLADMLKLEDECDDEE